MRIAKARIKDHQYPRMGFSWRVRQERSRKRLTDMIAAIKKAGGHPKYTEFANEAHGIWDIVSNTPGLLDWLFAQRRK